MRGLITAGFLFLFSLSAAVAVEPSLRFDVFLGLDGVVPEASWFPVTFEIQNDGPTFMGRLEIQKAGPGDAAVRTTTVELPRGTTKRLQIPMHGSGLYRFQWHARLIDERGRVRATAEGEPHRRMAWNGSLVGALPRTAASAPGFPRPLGSQDESRAAVARLVPDLIPENPLLLESLETIYLNSQRAPELKAPQVNALVAWLYGGGTLIVALDQTGDLAGAPWLARLLPGIPGRTVPAQAGEGLEEFATREWPVTPSRAPPMADAQADPRLAVRDEVFVAAGIPLVEWQAAEGAVPVPGLERRLGLLAPRGRGRIIALAFNPEREPFLSWSHRPWFWAALCGVKSQIGTPPAAYASSSTDALLGAVVETTQVRKLPLGWLLLLLVLYLVIIGPFDRWWLRRLRRPMLTWITFPCYVLGFSVLVYAIGYRLRAGDTEWNQMQVVDLMPYGSHSQIRVRSYGSIYSPSNQRYAFAGGRANAAFRGELSLRGGSALDGAVITSTGGGFESVVPVPVWTSQLLIQDSWVTNAAPLRVQLAGGRDARRLVVENDTGHPIERAWLVAGGGLHEFQNIRPGRSDLEVDVAGVPYPGIEAFVTGFQTLAQRVAAERLSAFGRDAEPVRLLPFEAGAFASFGRLARPAGPYDYERFAATGGVDLSHAVREGRAVFLGGLSGYLAAAESSRFAAARSHQYTLFRMVLPPSP